MKIDNAVFRENEKKQIENLIFLPGAEVFYGDASRFSRENLSFDLSNIFELDDPRPQYRLRSLKKEEHSTSTSWSRSMAKQPGRSFFELYDV